MVTNNFYVYVLFKTYKPGCFMYSDLTFDYEPFYVGKGHNNKGYNRLYASCRGGNTHKTNIINKHKSLGIGLTFKILKSGMTENEAHSFEKELIQKIGRFKDGGVLTNATDGGEGRFGEQPEKFRSVTVFDMNGFFIKTYDAIKKCVDDLHVMQRNVSDCCSKKRYTTGGYIFRYTDEFDVVPHKIDVKFLSERMHEGHKERAVIQYDMHMNFIQRYDSIKKAAEATGCLKSKIVAVCKGSYGAKSAKGFIWKYEK